MCIRDSVYAVWSAFDNHYWPAIYFADAGGLIRHHHFGEGEYQQSEMIIQQLLAEAGSVGAGHELVSVDACGVEAPADWATLRSPENYTGYERAENFSSPGGAVLGKRQVSVTPSPRVIAVDSLASISADAPASSPRHAASIGLVNSMGGVPVASAITSASSSSASAASNCRRRRDIREKVEGEREHSQRTSVPCDLHVAVGQLVPCIVIEQVRRNATSNPGPAHVSPATAALVANRAECMFERRRAGRVTIQETGGEAIEQQVGGTRHPLRGRRLASGLNGLQHTAAKAACDARRAQRLKICLPRQARIKQFQPPGRIKEQRHRGPAASQV